MNQLSQKAILFYTDTPIVGGAENQMYLLAKFLNKEKYRIILACADFPHLNEWAKKFELIGVDVQRLNVIHKHDPRHYFQLKDIIKEKKIDLMHIHIWNPASCRYALRLSQKYKIPTVVTEHDPFELSSFKTIIKKRLMKNIERIIAVSNANKKLISQIYPDFADNITTVHNGIDITWFESQNLSFSEKDIRDYKRNVFGVEENTKVILSVAELHERKGLNYLLSAFKYIVSEQPNSILVLAGIGPQEETLRRHAQELGITNNVRFIGFRKDIPHLMRTADVFVLPSIKEAFGLVVLEAYAAGVPIVASKVGGIPEIIQDDVTGTLIPPAHPVKLSEAIWNYLNNPAKARAHTLEAYKRLKKEFDAKTMAQKTEEIYDNIITLTAI